MGVTYLVWKWRAAANAGDVAEVVRSIGEDEDHPLAGRFDVKAFLKELGGEGSNPARAIVCGGGAKFLRIGEQLGGLELWL